MSSLFRDELELQWSQHEAPLNDGITRLGETRKQEIQNKFMYFV